MAHILRARLQLYLALGARLLDDRHHADGVGEEHERACHHEHVEGHLGAVGRRAEVRDAADHAEGAVDTPEVAQADGGRLRGEP